MLTLTLILRIRSTPLVSLLLLPLCACSIPSIPGLNRTIATVSSTPTPTPPPCFAFSCASPPEGCSYENLPVEGGCITGCGELKCVSSGDLACPSLSCNIPKLDDKTECKYSNPTFVDGCPVDCGTLECVSI